MSLTARDIETITRLLEESSFDELNLEMDGLKLTLRRGGAGEPAPSTARVQAAAVAATPAATPDAVPHATGVYAVPPSASQAGAQAITAPLLGTFYRAPRPGAAAFVDVGAEVEPDTVIGIIEVMKLMNAVRAGVSGRILDIQAQDGALVEYGQTLMRVEAPG